MIIRIQAVHYSDELDETWPDYNAKTQDASFILAQLFLLLMRRKQSMVHLGISRGQSGTLIIGSGTIPLSAPQTSLTPLLMTDNLTIETKSSLATADGVTVSPGAADVTADDSAVSLQSGRLGAGYWDQSLDNVADGG